MQRVRVGLTGLACVFLLVFLAAAFFGLARPDPAVSGVEDAPVSGLDGNTIAEPREPLAELGVTPGNVPGADTPSGDAATAPAAPPAASPAATPAVR